MQNLNEVVNQIYALTEDKEKTPESILSIIRSTIVGYKEDIVKIKKVNHRKNTLNNEDPRDFPLTNYEIINEEDGQRHNSDFYTNIFHALNRNLIDKKVIKAILNDYCNSPITKKNFESETDALYQLKQLFNNFNSSITEECNNRIDELAKSDPFIEQIRAEVGMVFQQFNLFTNMKVLENVTYALLKVKKFPKQQAIEAAMKMLRPYWHCTTRQRLFRHRKA